ncbi:Ras GTPase activating protein ira2 [Metarhizium acridum]|nr:Ras GTPase activating protein ira2 [Metarhizium acridum]
MTQTGIDQGRRRAVLYPLQMTLLLLLPDVFEVASNLREAKSNNLIKKVSFLDSLRKALRNGNERAAYCLVSLLRAARHFEAESDSALVSYAMDVQDEIRESVFSLSQTNIAIPQFDQDMITGAFVSLAHLGLDGSVETLTKACISSSAPDSFKIAVIQACSYFARQSETTKYSALQTRVLALIQSEFESEYMNSFKARRELSQDGNRKVLEILRYLYASPGPLLRDLSGETADMAFLKPFLFCVLSRDQSIRQLATKVANKLFIMNKDSVGTSQLGHRDATEELGENLWIRSSSILLELCGEIEKDISLSTITQLREFLGARSALLKGMPILSHLPMNVPDIHLAASKLETTLLISICSPNIAVCQLATVCIGLLVDECTHVGEYTDSAKLLSSTYRNQLVYQELSSPAFHFTGLVAFQKRMRGFLRQIRLPTQGIMDAWETAFDHWIHLSKEVSLATADGVDDRMLSEWRNLSGFLASLGGICTYGYASKLDEAIGDLNWIDRVSFEHHEEPLLSRFLRLSIQLLGCNNIKVREAMREVLSTEVSSILYAPLFKALESELEVLLAGVLASPDQGQENEVIFAEQAASLLKIMVEKLESPSDLGSISSVHLGVLTLSFAKFLDGALDGVATLRVKVKICHLCEAVTKRKEHLNLRDDIRIRNQLLEYIFGWIARPHSLKQEQLGNGPRQDEFRRVQKDLDKACLRTLGDLTFRLPLQPADSQSDAGMSELKSQMFHTYFNRFLSLLNYETQEMSRQELPLMGNRDEGLSNADLVITILSNLLSANIDVGLKHSLNIGYHENVDIRAAFVRVLCNILTQGTEFSSLTDAAVSDKYVELLNLLTTDLSLSVSMSAICPASEVDELTICLLTVFEQRGLTFELFEALIRQEVEQTENETEILRRTCVATKMLSVYAKWKGASYLRTTLQKVLERLMLTSNDLDLELDPARVSTPGELQKNAAQLQIVAKVFMDDICASTSNVPSSFRRICSIISDAVLPRFPNAKYTAVGAFVFLRFFCPAIVAPEAEGLVSVAPTKEMRRGLLLIAKIIQNLANNVLFGTKEPYMFPLNPFLVQNIHLVTGFLRDISVPSRQVDAARPTIDVFDFGSCVSLHRFLYDHWDHLRQTLVARERKEHLRTPEEIARTPPSVFEPLRGLISNLGPPPLAISWNRPQISCNTPPLYSRFQNFMLRNAFRSAESFLTARAVYDGGESKDGLSTVCVILRHIENESIDYDTLLYCFLKIASRLWHEPFGLFIDATCYNGRSEPSDEFFSKLGLLTPSELSRNFSRIYIYNMNSAFNEVRLLVYKLLINSIHAICASFSIDDAKLVRLRSILDIFGDTRGDIFTAPTSLARDGASVSTSLDSGPALALTENLTSVLFEVCLIAAPSMDIANAWRARWMSLVASTAFQNNPAVQPRAFAVMGYLAREEVDDDLLYQVLVALRNSVSQFGEDGNSEMLVSIITSLSKMMAKLPSSSRYGLQLFWLAMSLVRLVPAAIFNCAAQFLGAILTNIGTIGNVRGDKMVPLLLQCRSQLEDAALPLDDAYGIRFEEDTFHFAVCACLVRGLTDTATRPTAIQVLSSFLEMTSRSEDPVPGSPNRAMHGSPYLALLLARGMQEDFMDSLWWSDLKTEAISDILDSRGVQGVDNMKDKDLLLISAMELVDFHCLEGAAQARSLRWLNSLAEARPVVFTSLCGALTSVLDDVLLHSQESAALEAAHVLLRTLASDQKYAQAMGSMHSLNSQLTDMGFGGLWKTPKQSTAEDAKGECFELTEKLIEVGCRQAATFYSKANLIVAHRYVIEVYALATVIKSSQRI